MNYTCRIAFASDPFASTPTWVDVSSDLMNFHTRRGRQWELNRLEAGTATVRLRNQHGNYWPDNTTGSYTPNVLPWKRINLRQGANLLTNPSFETADPPSGWSTLLDGDGAFARSAVVSKIGTYSGVLSKVTGGYADAYQAIDSGYVGSSLTLGAWINTADANHGRVIIFDGVANQASAYVAGDSDWHFMTVTATIQAAGALAYIVNDDAGAATVYFDGAMLVAGNLAAPTHDYELNTYDLYTGYIESWQPDFVLRPIKAPAMDLSCSDGIKNLSQYLINNATGYAAEVSGTRVTNVLNQIGWPTSARTIGTGQSPLQSTGEIVNTNAMTHLFTVEDTELGIIFESASGDMVFQDRHARLQSPYTTSQATFGDTATTSQYANILLSLEDLRIYNDIRVTRLTGTEQVATSTTSADSYGVRSLERPSLLMQTDAEALAQAQYLLNRYAAPVMRCKQIVMLPNSNPSTLYPMLAHDLSTRMTVKLDQASLSRDYHIEGINHDLDVLDPVGIRTTWMLSDANTEQFWILGEAGFTELDSTTKLAY